MGRRAYRTLSGFGATGVVVRNHGDSRPEGQKQTNQRNPFFKAVHPNHTLSKLYNVALESRNQATKIHPPSI